jgi:antitoxin MazE
LDFAYNIIRKYEILKGLISMLVELRGRSQITIPSEIVKNLGIKEGDKFEVIEKDGGIFLCPVVVYPKSEMARIARLLKETEKELENGDVKSYDDIDKMFEDMGIKLDEV